MAGPEINKPIVYILRRNTECGRCKRELWDGEFICLTAGEALCLDCSGLAHLEYLPAGDTAITRRAARYSGLTVLVMKKSAARKRSERQGILAEPEAIRRAEAESAADAEKRARQQAKAAERREKEDQQYIATFAQAILAEYPRCPPADARAIAQHACRKYSGRIGRTAAAKQFDRTAVRLAVAAHIRHTHTQYDELLTRHGDRHLARSEVKMKIQKVLEKWQRGAAGSEGRGDVGMKE